MSQPNRPMVSSSSVPPKVTMAPGQGSQNQPNTPRSTSSDVPPKISMPSMSGVKSAGFRSGLQKAAAAQEEDNVTDSEVAIAILAEMGVELTPAQIKVAAEGEKKKLSTGAKAALGIGAVAGAAALGLGGANKALGGRFSAIQGARALGRGGMAGVSAGRSIMAGNKNVKIRDGVAAATKDGLSAARRAAKSKR